MQTLSKVQPINNIVLIKPFPPEGVSEGGIYVPENFRARNTKSLVISTGPGTIKRPMKFESGMIVHVVKDWGTPIKIDGELHFLMEDAALLASEN